MQNEKDYFNLRSFFILLLRHTKTLFLFFLSGLLSGLIIALISGYKQYTNPELKDSDIDINELNNQREVIKDGINLYENYNNRPLMRLNPTSVSVTNVSLFISTDYQLNSTLTIQPPDPTIDLVRAYWGIPITAGMVDQINSELGTDYDITAVRELIKFRDIGDDETKTSILNLVVYGKDSSESSYIAKVFTEGSYDLINPTVYNHKLVIVGQSTSLNSSEELAEIQKNNLEAATHQIEKLESELSKINATISMMSPINIIIKAAKYGGLGGVAMLIFGVIVLLVLDSLNTHLYTGDAYLKRYNEPIFGTISGMGKYRKGSVKNLIYYLEHGTRKPYISLNDQLNMIRENLMMKTGDLSGKTVLLTGSVGQVELLKTAKHLATNLCENSISAKYYDNSNNLKEIYSIAGNDVLLILSPSVTESGNTVKILRKVDYILLVENLKKSSYISVDSIIRSMKQFNVKPLGFILLD